MHTLHISSAHPVHVTSTLSALELFLSNLPLFSFTLPVLLFNMLEYTWILGLWYSHNLKRCNGVYLQWKTKKNQHIQIVYQYIASSLDILMRNIWSKTKFFYCLPGLCQNDCSRCLGNWSVKEITQKCKVNQLSRNDTVQAEHPASQLRLRPRPVDVHLYRLCVLHSPWIRHSHLVSTKWRRCTVGQETPLIYCYNILQGIDGSI